VAKGVCFFCGGFFMSDEIQVLVKSNGPGRNLARKQANPSWLYSFT
jgi:hypothetical protein